MDFDNVDGRQVVSGVLGGVLVLGVLGLVVYAVAPIAATPGDTEFYVVNESRTAAGYPTQPAVGENVTFVVGIENNEHRQITYDLVVRTVPRELEHRKVTLADGRTWERPVTISFEDSGPKRLRLHLYRGDVDKEPYRELYLNFDVRNA